MSSVAHRKGLGWYNGNALYSWNSQKKIFNSSLLVMIIAVVDYIYKEIYI